MVEKTVYNLFKQGSRTYFYSSLFFPKYLRNNVFVLYAFVRKADDFVDDIPQDREGFLHFRNEYEYASRRGHSEDIVVELFIRLMKDTGIKKQWVQAFLDSMAMDMDKHVYHTLEETEQYIYGSAEVVGLMMCRLMRLKEQSYYFARHLGKAMQYINFIRDINEDLELGRYYLPGDRMEHYGLKSLDEDYVRKHKQAYKSFIREQLSVYRKWQSIAQRGYAYIPRIFLIPIKTAADMYIWTAKQIEKNPMIVYRKKVKPSIFYIAMRTFLNTVESI